MPFEGGWCLAGIVRGLLGACLQVLFLNLAAEHADVCTLQKFTELDACHLCPFLCVYYIYLKVLLFK